MYAKTSNHPRGVISLIALIVMATITAIAITASTLVINELRQTESIDQSYVAVYAAETGVEDALYSVRYDRQNMTLADEQTKLNDSTSNTYHALDNTASWQRSIGTETELSVAELSVDQTARVDYFDPDSPSASSNVRSLSLSWKDDCSGNVAIETSATTWSSTGGYISFDPASQQVYKQINRCDQFDGTTCIATINQIIAADVPFYNLDPLVPYRFSFRPVLLSPANDCHIKNLHVTAYRGVDGGGDVVPLPVKLIVKSTGAFALSQQAQTVSLPWKFSPSGLLNYVLFSDKDIVK